LIRREQYVEMPWRNGGGTTFEIARSPATGNEFDWRLSLARIDRSGPFSNFAGYQRAIVLVSGAGCVLHGIEADGLVLDAPGRFAIFPGAAQVRSDLLAGSCEDFNLMAREPARIVHVKHLHAIDADGELLSAAHYSAVFCLGGRLMCGDDLDERRNELHFQDTFIVAPTNACRWRVRANDPKAAALVCTWENPRQRE
jgi:environmental stress-induced protein Ves